MVQLDIVTIVITPIEKGTLMECSSRRNINNLPVRNRNKLYEII